jgi:hypothetical protein
MEKPFAACILMTATSMLHAIPKAAMRLRKTENQPERAWKFGHDGEKHEFRGPANTAEVARRSPVRSFVFMDVASTRGGANGKAKCERLEIKEVCANSKDCWR